jgi:hypothetical protein
MEPPSSRRRKPITGDEPDRTSSRQHGWPIKSLKSYCISLCPVFTCLVVLFVFWRQWDTPDQLKTIIPVDIPHIYHQPESPGTTSPGIELHPEDHAYRDPGIQHLDWTLSSKEMRPDGVLKRVYLINGNDDPHDIELDPANTDQVSSPDQLSRRVQETL